MKLSELCGPSAAPAECDDGAITGLTADSREVRPGYLFAALNGVKTDGARFIADAVARGAAAILAGDTAPVEAEGRIPVDPGRQSAPPPRADGRALLRPAAGDRRRRHRYQRQDLGRRVPAADLGSLRTVRRQPRHDGHPLPEPGLAARPHHARSGFARTQASPNSPIAARRIWHSRPQAMASRNIGWTGSSSRPERSPTFPATISIITRTSPTISAPRCACSPSCCSPASPLSSTWIARAARRRRRSRAGADSS